MWPLAVVGGGVVAGVGGFLFRRAAKDKQADLCQLTTMPGNCDFPLQAGKETQAEDLKSAMRTREILSWSFYGVGVAAVGAGLFLYFTQSEDSGSSVAVSAAPASDGGMVFFSFTH
jgi:hypothetical protein